MSAHEDEDAGNTSEVDRRFAGMLAELEDLATELTQSHAAKLREADAIAMELERVENTRAAMLGKPKRRAVKEYPPRTTPRAGEKDAARRRVERITEYMAEQAGPVDGRQVADFLEMPYQGVGPIMAGMVRRGEATVTVGQDRINRYTLVSPNGDGH